MTVRTSWPLAAEDGAALGSDVHELASPLGTALHGVALLRTSGGFIHGSRQQLFTAAGRARRAVRP
ncbi:hypothetical protein ACIHCQ_41725 [Streptomyces sp. NPDC052236]|uniref:hypothetical protein n=1 Tax=Streptomyces sp. NPDC052236 TaxID=3365686 RepID=UPI0037D4FF90